MDTLRKPFFLAALYLVLAIVAVETGSGFFFPTPAGLAGEFSPDSSKALGFTGAQLDAVTGTSLPQGRPAGYGIAAMSCLDATMLFTILLMAAQFFLGERVQGRVQGIVTLLFAFLALIGAIGAIFVLLAKLMLMVGLLLAFPFGTLAYLVMWGSFNTGAAAGTLGVLLLLKLAFAVCLVLAQQRFLQNKGLVLIIVASLVANLVVGFLHALVPGFLVSITDVVAGIVVLILGAIWAVVLLVGSVISIVKALA